MVMLPSTHLIAQDDNATCPSIVEAAYELIDDSCAGLGQDEACLGNIAVEARPDDLSFADAGDVVAVPDLESLRLSEMDEANNIWGISLMRIRATFDEDQPA